MQESLKLQPHFRRMNYAYTIQSEDNEYMDPKAKYINMTLIQFKN